MKRVKTIAVSVSLLSVSLPACAVSEGAVPYEVVRVISADAPQRGTFNWKCRTMYYSQEFMPDFGEQYSETQVSLAVGAGYALTDRIGAGMTGELTRSVGDTSTAWLGRIDFELKIYVYESPHIRGGVGLVTAFSAYNSEDEGEPTTIQPMLALTFDSADQEGLPPYRIHLNGGYRATTDSDRSDDLLVLGVALELLAREFTPFMEFTTEQSLDDDGLGLTGNPARLTPGITWNVTEGINVTLGLDLSLSKPPLPGLKTVEDWNVSVGVSRF